MFKQLQISCETFPTVSTLTINSDLEVKEVEINISLMDADGGYDALNVDIGKKSAEQIVNHLIKVFDITPEQRNK